MMLGIKRSLFLTLGASALLFSPSAVAQSLQHRPQAPAPEAPQPSPEPAKPAAPVLPQGTVLQVEIPRNYPMKSGETLEGRLVYSLFVDGHLAVPANTPVQGAVVALDPDKKTRWHGRLRGDLTPFHTPRVQFNQIALPSGPVSLVTTGAVTGAPVLHLAAPGASPHRSFVGKYWSLAKECAHQQIAFFVDPGLGGRALQLLYQQLPYHPEHIPAHTAWTVELASPVALPGLSQAAAPPADTAIPGHPEIWSVHALLAGRVTSATAKPGDPVQALVIEPVYDKDRQLVVPQGSTLVGRVTTAKSARSLGRNGKLRFTFQQVKFPPGNRADEEGRTVQGALSGASPQSNAGLSLDAEGTVTPKSQSSVIAPLLLTMLAGRALDNDGNLTAQTGVSSNGFGLVGRVVGIAAGNRNFAAGLGFYAAALSTYENFLRPGRDVDFPKDTRIEIETTPLRAPVLKPQGSSQ
ncbi:TrbI/VirB10 family protein [Acidobacteria bacterium AB60]|nr:TrbI/VirB10 family protein [Acidobacteria bacterium AB60]